jgi:hypothetical protein
MKSYLSIDCSDIILKVIEFFDEIKITQPPLIIPPPVIISQCQEVVGFFGETEKYRDNRYSIRNS